MSQNAAIKVNIYEDEKSRSYELTLLFLLHFAVTISLVGGTHIIFSAGIGSFGIMLGITNFSKFPPPPLIRPQV